MCNSDSQDFNSETKFTAQVKPQLTSRSGNVPETGPIDLEALEKDSADATLTFNVKHSVPAHILSSDSDHGTGGSYDAADDQQKSPNVYINGLPSHFPEEQLFELAAPFGEIRSVRSFTRHVGEKESGYGFVLFETVEAAEKCIQSLRRFRNLHPTFSKNDNGPSLAHGTGVRSSAAGGGTGMNQTGEFSFKTKMEHLQDPNSTNLYIEGCAVSFLLLSPVLLVRPFDET
ncbi:hypothetical protein EV368DRAFT_38965 [Lentinula lateritia]|uniref:Uncharacterized protein n=1 Tax=Lentinula aff. lateritia TaxID=2804960 RepID=A0ACC1UDB2_9AGAR|nr:hypothetical protein F5876DRAFT_31440 [Lentinula aff. lateritia]KAJ3853427.1 hypothetical protein EV368DRAFT_38965 [Lentinula lateritia]